MRTTHQVCSRKYVLLGYRAGEEKCWHTEIQHILSRASRYRKRPKITVTRWERGWGRSLPHVTAVVTFGGVRKKTPEIRHRSEDWDAVQERGIMGIMISFIFFSGSSVALLFFVDLICF